jgi:hypothetical protein
MGRFGSFVPRLLALTVVWLLATAALTFAAAQRIATPHAPAATTTAAAPAPARTLVVPDVRAQAFVFAKGTLSDAGFAFRVVGPVQGYPSNSVSSQSPAPGTSVVDTGAPTIVLHLSRSGAETGVPEDASATPGTAVRLADLALNPVVTPAVPPVAPVVKAKVKPAATKHVKAKPATRVHAVAVKTKPAPAKQSPKPKWPQHRPAAFVVAGARREPLDEMPLTVRAHALLTWVDGRPQPTNANVRRWLFQHAWIVTGAQLGWWHGSAALKTLEQVDQKVWQDWGIGARSDAVAHHALAEVEARSS